jgi:dipeptidyl aminopeptidase/acylaminoacyl peptidase
MTNERKRRPVHPDDHVRFKTLQEAKVSPDGKKIVYALSYIEGEIENVDLWLLSLGTGESQRLTFGKARNWSPDWSPDSTTLAFLSAREELPQVYLLSLKGGEAQRLTSMPQGVGGGPKWSPDGKYIAFTSGPERPPIDPTKPVRVSRPIYRADTLGYLRNVQQDIYVIPQTVGEPKRLTNDSFYNSNPLWSPDGSEILYFASYFPDEPREYPALRAVNLEGEVRELVNEWGYPKAATWSANGESIYFAGSPFTRYSDVHHELYVVDRQGGTPECRTSKMTGKIGAYMQSDLPTLFFYYPTILPVDGEQVAYIPAQTGGVNHIYRVSMKGEEKWTPIIKGERICQPIGLIGDRIVFAASSMYSLIEIFSANLDGTDEQQLTHLNDEIIDKLQLAEAENLKWPTIDGTEIEGWIIKPPASEPPYPTIAYAHGGPHAAFTYVFNFVPQVLAAKGYAVLLYNYRGSTGYGEEFAACLHGNYGQMEHDDLMTGLDLLVEKGISDSDKLGMFGISHGGVITCYEVGQTDRFQAALAGAAATNWTSFYGTSQCGMWYAPEAMGGLPHEVPEVYARSSPVTHAHRCTTPTLLVLGETDFLAPPEQHEQFYAILRSNGCVTEMLRLPGCSHSSFVMGSIPIRRAIYEAIFEWFNRFLPVDDTE